MLAVVASAAAAADDAQTLFATHCGACHGSGAEEGGLAIDVLLETRAETNAAQSASGRGPWLAVWHNLRAETMPPADEPRPSPADRQAMLDFVEQSVLGIDREDPDPGRIVLRRLNRFEYASTVRDLTDLEIDVAAELPPDDTGYGFDTIGEVLSMSPLLVEKYMAAAAQIGDAAIKDRRFVADDPPPPDADGRAGWLRQAVERLAERAFRRPVDRDTLDRLLDVARSAMDAAEGKPENGMAAALTAVLASPRFLFRIESSPAEITSLPADTRATAVPIDDYALASRLSYFLWSSMPDAELFDLARAGRLHAELPGQIDRMIADRRSDRFIDSFVGQWLQTRDVESLAFDVRTVLGTRHRFAGERIFSSRVREAMRRETEMLFGHLLRENLPATDLLVGRETFLNGPLARFYGVPNVEGPEMRLVALPDDSHRGGLLTHGSLLVVTSNPTRTSPVKRGLFILTNLLGTPPPPPPPDVPPLENAARDAAAEPTMRELMELHRRDPLCASCHARMDPLGLALEHYNAVGQWRGNQAKEIDTSGRLITGEPFANVQELAEVIAGPRRRDFLRCLTEKLLTYALGRGVEAFDAPAVDTIVEDVERHGGGLATLVKGVCRSVPFRMRRSDAAATADEGSPPVDVRHDDAQSPEREGTSP
ncbi:MAG: DUF1592 domain-containing protein [Pirellulales bacterium]